MTTQIVIGSLKMAGGGEIPLRNDSATDSVANRVGTEILTDSAFTVSALSIGDYQPGGVITHAILSAKTHLAWAYIVRQGLVATVIPVLSRTAQSGPGSLPLCVPFTLQPGDKLLAYTEA
jgi:hypothetical protein